MHPSSDVNAFIYIDKSSLKVGYYMNQLLTNLKSKKTDYAQYTLTKSLQKNIN